MKKLRKTLLPKKSKSIKDLRKQLSEDELNLRASRFAPSITKLKVSRSQQTICGECGFVPKTGDKIRLIEYGNPKQIVCEVCFENRDIADWEFVDRELYDY